MGVWRIIGSRELVPLFAWGNVEERFMGIGKRKTDRVRFEFGYPARIVAIDGTWFRDCLIEDISPTGARISLSGSIDGLNLAEFFLALSRTGAAHRR